MLTQELYKIMDEEITCNLTGQLSFDGTVLKWEYDGLDHLYDDLEDHLDITSHEDKELIEDFLTNHDEFVVTEPETHDTFAYFYVEK